MSHDHTMMSQDFYVGRLLQGNYLIERLVGKGGMAWVYKAEHIKFKQPMAIKILLPHISGEQEIRNRFLEEARIQFKLKHPSIVQVTDVIEDGSMIAIVMEWIGGDNLKQLLRKLERPISRKDIWRIMGPILDAIGYAHRQGLVHRDIKPANILLHTEGDRLVPKIADFGIAKVLDEAMEGRTATGITMGTLKFMPPEQIRDSKRVDHRADIYSLGATLYVMATRRLPFLGKGDWVVYQQLNEDPPPPSSFNPTLSDAFDQVVLRCMDKRPEGRYQNCAELAQALSLALLDPQNIKRLSTQELNAIDLYNLLVSMPEENSVYSSSVELMAPAVIAPMPLTSQSGTDSGSNTGGRHETAPYQANAAPAAPPQGHYQQAQRTPTDSMGAFQGGEDTGNSGNSSPTNEAHAATTPATPHRPQMPPHPGFVHRADPPSEMPLASGSFASHPAPTEYTPSGASYNAISQVGSGSSANSLVFKTAALTMLLMLSMLGLGAWLFSQRSKRPVQPNVRGQYISPMPQPLIRNHQACSEGSQAPCYEGPNGSAGKGICKAGTKTCTGGKWQACQGQIKPLEAELCNGLDDNCNGQIDEAFADKGKACQSKFGDCPVQGKMACKNNGQGLYCRPNAKPTEGKGQLMVSISPGRGFRVLYRGRKRSVSGKSCISLSRKTSVTFFHPRFYKCVLNVSPSTRRLRIRMKRVNPNDLDPPVNYCLR